MATEWPALKSDPVTDLNVMLKRILGRLAGDGPVPVDLTLASAALNRGGAAFGPEAGFWMLYAPTTFTVTFNRGGPVITAVR